MTGRASSSEARRRRLAMASQWLTSSPRTTGWATTYQRPTWNSTRRASAERSSRQIESGGASPVEAAMRPSRP